MRYEEVPRNFHASLKSRICNKNNFSKIDWNRLQIKNKLRISYLTFSCCQAGFSCKTIGILKGNFFLV
jgi:hypothetical protein